MRSPMLNNNNDLTLCETGETSHSFTFSEAHDEGNKSQLQTVRCTIIHTHLQYATKHKMWKCCLINAILTK